MAHSPSPLETNGEAANPGPGGAHRLRRRGPRSEASMQRRHLRQKPDKSEFGVVPDELFIILHLNIQGRRTNSAELAAKIRMMPSKPALLCVNETFLDRSVERIQLEGYEIVHRLDRRSGKQSGGVLIMAATEIAASVAFLEEGGEQDERIWAMVHTLHGPYLVCSWYRPPGQGEDEEMNRFEAERHRLGEGVMGTIVTGDV